MMNISFDLSGKIDRQKVDALLAIKKETDSLNIDFFVVGAFARDIILKHYEKKSRRVTEDIDLGINIADWAQFDKLTNSLISTGKFSRTKDQQRYLYNSIQKIDIIPFGAIAGKKDIINWPDHEMYMTVVGFQEVFKNSFMVRLNCDPDLDVKVPTFPGLTIMKLVAWRDRFPDRQKDAGDLSIIMNEYEDAGNTVRLYDEAPTLLEEEGFDLKLASIRLLGRDMALIADQETANVIKSLFQSKKYFPHKLIVDIIQERRILNDNYETISLQLEKLKKGFIETLKKR